jgi:hypothetical protein
MTGAGCMRVVGVAVEAKKPKRPAARVVVVDNASGSPTVEDVIDLTGDDVDLPAQLHYASEALRSHLKSAGATRVVVRRADHAPRAKQTDGTKNRLLMEGALTASATSVVPDTRIGTGKETGEWFGSSKDAVEAEADALLKGGGHHKRFAEATSAALAALALGP